MTFRLESLNFKLRTLKRNLPGRISFKEVIILGIIIVFSIRTAITAIFTSSGKRGLP
jgi:hypothetical protein